MAKKHVLIFLGIATVFSPALCMNFSVNYEVRHIQEYVKNVLANPTDPFSVTQLIRSTGDILTLKGDLFALDKEDLRDIEAGNFVYVPSGCITKTRLSGNRTANIGAIIVGTQNKRIQNTIKFALLWPLALRVPV